MPIYIKLIFVCVIFISGCQSLNNLKSSFYDSQKSEPSAPFATIEHDEEKFYQLLFLGNHYSRQTKDQQQLNCKQLKQQYDKKKNWQQAWLIAYSLNKNFSCISLSKTLSLLKEIQTELKPTDSLYWLNENQIQLFNTLSYLQSKNRKYKRKNAGLKEKLNEAEIQLQDVISKIQALKVIETTINQKTQ